MDLLERVRETIRRHALAGSGGRVVSAVSGGSDSVALAYLLSALSESGDLQLVGFAHFNHQLRAAADADEQHCVELAAALGVPILVDREDVGARARRDRLSIEAAARAARYEFFERALRHFGGDRIALGHTRDDQAETFLLRLTRGAGARGLASIHPRRDAIIRPLIDCRRSALRDDLARRGIRYMDDESNEDVSIPRNRVRHELLPLMASRFNPSIVDALADAAEIARGEWAWLREQAEWLQQRISVEASGECRIDAPALGDAPDALARMVVHATLSRTSGGRPIGLADVERVISLSRNGGPAFDAPGQHVQLLAGKIVLTSSTLDGWSEPARHFQGAFSYQLPVPGEVELPEAGWVVSAQEGGPISPSACAAASTSSKVLVRRAECHEPLSVRSRRPGDRFWPLGLDGQKKLQDFFVDKKVVRGARDRVPLVVDSDDRIVWVAGHAIDERFRITDPAQAVIILRLKVLGGFA